MLIGQRIGNFKMKSFKEILVVVDSIDVNDSSGSKVNVALIKNLHQLGYKVKVLHYSRKEINLSGVSCTSVKELKYSLNYFLSRTQRVFTRITDINLHAFFENIFGFSFTFFNDINSITKAISKENISTIDLILTLSKGGSFRPHYAMLKFQHMHKKWMAYIHDPYPFSCYPKPYDWVEPGNTFKMKFFKKVSESAKFSGFPSLLLNEWMGQFFPNFNKTGIVIPHQINSNKLKKKTYKSLPVYFDSTKFNILHAGNLMKQRNPIGLIKGYQLFLDRNSKAKTLSKLLLIGNANYHKEKLKKYESEIDSLIVESTNMNFDIVSLMQQKTTVNVILEAKSKISPFLPGKFPQCIKARKIILHLGPMNSETIRLLGKDYAYNAEIDDVKEIAIKIEELYYNWRKDNNSMKLLREDIENYISIDYLDSIIRKIA